MVDLDLDFYNRQMTQWEVSSFDIIQSPIYNEWLTKHDNGMETFVADEILQDIENLHLAFVRPPKKVMDKVLHSLGMDINKLPSRQICRHKTFAGNVVYGERYVGVQRSDKDWVNFVKQMVK